MKIKTSELTGAALDWAVAKCEGVKVVKLKHGRATFSDPFDDGALNEMFINYSTDWAQGGPIIEREGISIDQRDNGSPCWPVSTHLWNTKKMKYGLTAQPHSLPLCVVM